MKIPWREPDKTLARVFELDLRSLALFRILIGFLFTFDVLDRWRDLKAHYTNAGIVPHGLAQHLMPEGANIAKTVEFTVPSLHFISGSMAWQIGVFTLALVAGLSFILGYKTKLANVICWIWGVSALNASPLMIYPGDFLLNILLFSGLFVPLGAVFSLDARSANPPSGRTTWTMALPLFAANMFFMISSGLAKTAEEWGNGTAIKTIMAVEIYTTPMRNLLIPFEDAMALMTHMTVWVERGLPFLFILPLMKGRLRLGAILGLVGLLAGIRVFIASQNLSFICISGLLALLPPLFWEKLNKIFSHERTWQPPPPTKSHPCPWLCSTLIIGFLALSVVLEWNRLKGFGYGTAKIPLPTALQRLVEVMRFENNNVMFGPNVKRIRDGWIIISAKTKSGSNVDLISGKPNDFSLAARNNIADFSLRWRRFFTNTFFKLSSDKKPIFRHLYAQYLCRAWNEKFPEDPIDDAIEIVRMDYTYTGDQVIPTGAQEGFRSISSCTSLPPADTNP